MDTYAKLCSFANKYLRDADASRDIVHDLFVKIWENQVSVRNGAALESFLYTSVKNACLNYRRNLNSRDDKSGNVQAFYSDLNSDSIYEHAVLEKDTFKKVYDYIQGLPAKSRKVMDLHLEGLTNEEIKNYLDVSMSTVKTLKRISYNKIRENFRNLN
jgi:RNA polymerase sigma-70 factor (ECF subfamily)